MKEAALRSGVLRLASRAGKRRVAILRYHSVLPVPGDFGNSIGSGIIHSSRAFAEQMEFIASRYHPVTMDEVCAFVDGERDLPPFSVAITFDDGFADNLEVAAPILARVGIPAAFYLAVDYIGNLIPPWYVRLRYAFSVSTIQKWPVEENTILDMSLSEQRYEAFLDSSKKCAQLCRGSQEELLAEIEVKLGVTPFSSPVMLTWEGVRNLLRKGHIVGSHTLSHPNVAYVSGQELTDEIAGSKLEIEKNILTKVKHFSYPSPILEPHHSDKTLGIAKAAGYQSAVTCLNGAVVRGDNRLSLKRVYVPPTISELEWALENSFAGRSV